jgi:hypothetical protein
MNLTGALGAGRPSESVPYSEKKWIRSDGTEVDVFLACLLKMLILGRKMHALALRHKHVQTELIGTCIRPCSCGDDDNSDGSDWCW